MFEDFDLIISSFQTQYGIRVYSNTFKTMTWKEFSTLLSGLSEETPLGRTVAIRAETDRNIIKNFTSDQRRIYNDWRKKKASDMSKEQYEREMKQLESEIQKLFT